MIPLRNQSSPYRVPLSRMLIADTKFRAWRMSGAAGDLPSVAIFPKLAVAIQNSSIAFVIPWRDHFSIQT
jgi:hypothetical protein